MDWEQLRRSTNVQDRRGGGLGGGLAIGGGGAILIALVSLLFGANPGDVLNNLTGGGSAGQYERTPENDRNADFAARILGGTEDVWTDIFQKSGRTYQPAGLVLYDGTTSTQGCGGANANVGPFYCPADKSIYIDLRFFREMETRFGAGGDFARAYVIAHEVGHHLQQELGIEQQVRQLQERSDRVGRNRLSVLLELQADCFAGVWGNRTADVVNLSQADIREAVNAAAAIGDDALTQGRASPDSFTHGTSEQRVSWFTRGLKSGSVDSCDTFSASAR
jgi:predicted metalloprotease